MSGRRDALLLADLVYCFCFAMSDWLGAVWVSDEEPCLNEWASGWLRLENRISHTHNRTHARARIHTPWQDTDVSYFNTKTPSSHCPPSLAFISLPLHLISPRAASGCVQIHSLWKWKAAQRGTVSVGPPFSYLQSLLAPLSALTYVSGEIKDLWSPVQTDTLSYSFVNQRRACDGSLCEAFAFTAFLQGARLPQTNSSK